VLIPQPKIPFSSLGTYTTKEGGIGGGGGGISTAAGVGSALGASAGAIWGVTTLFTVFLMILDCACMSLVKIRFNPIARANKRIKLEYFFILLPPSMITILPVF